MMIYRREEARVKVRVMFQDRVCVCVCVSEAKLKTIPTVQELSEQGKNLLAEGKQYAEVHRIVYYCGETIPFSFTL